MPEIRAQWRMLRLTERFVRDVALSIGLPRRLVQLFWNNAPSSAAWPPSTGLENSMGVLTLLNRYYSRKGDEHECFICYSIPRNGVKTKCCHRIICRSCAEACFTNRYSFLFFLSRNAVSHLECLLTGSLAKCAWCRTQAMVSMEANFEPVSDEENLFASHEKERLMKEKCSLVVEFYISEFIYESERDNMNEPILKLLVDLVCVISHVFSPFAPRVLPFWPRFEDIWTWFPVSR